MPGEKFYITTSIPYVNAPPHIGHALEFVQADAIARFRRLKGDNVFFLTGTDEHGAKIARAAHVAGKTPRRFVDEHTARFQKLLELLLVSHDDFIRTSDTKRHWPGAEELWTRLENAGDIYKATYKGLYCIGHEAFVTEKDLKDGICEDHGKPPEVIEEENYFFRLSKYSHGIEARIESGELSIIPEKRKNEMLSFVREGLSDISFSRPSKDIPWGIPVPRDASATMYVWCDALSNYITALGFGSPDDSRFRLFWPADLHVIGKDISRFHTLIWPGMLLAAGLPLPKKIFVHGFILSGGRKMSKTIGNVIDPFDLISTYGAEALRYFLLREIPVFDDGDITRQRFEEAYTAHLANGVGNLVSRTAAMVKKYFSGHIVQPSDETLFSVPFKSNIDTLHIPGRDLDVSRVSIATFANSVRLRWEQALEEYNFNDALGSIWDLIGVLDKYIQEYEPYKLIATDKEKTQAVLWQLSCALGHIAWFLVPLLPGTATRIQNILGIKENEMVENKHEYSFSEKGDMLFPRIS